MRALGIDTATATASVGLATATTVIAERRRPMAADHARSVLSLVDEALAAADLRLADLDLLAVSIGPGSFTGLRIGVATIKGLALATGLPVVEVPTLEAYATALGRRAGTIWTLLDARKGEVYAAAYRWEAQGVVEIVPPAAVAPAALGAALQPPCILLGDGVKAHADVWPAGAGIERMPLTACAPSGAVVAQLATRRPAAERRSLAALEPRYCRRPEAEERRLGSVATGVSTG